MGQVGQALVKPGRADEGSVGPGLAGSTYRLYTPSTGVYSPHCIAIEPGLIGLARAEIGSGLPGWAAQVASPGSPQKPQIKPEELSLLFMKSQDITHIFQKRFQP